MCKLITNITQDSLKKLLANEVVSKFYGCIRTVSDIDISLIQDYEEFLKFDENNKPIIRKNVKPINQLLKNEYRRQK